jgi:hypothetical protein
MLEFARKIHDSMLSELDNLKMSFDIEDMSPEQFRAFGANAIERLKDYGLQMMTIVECQDKSTPGVGSATSATALIIPVDYKLEWTASKVDLTEVIYAFKGLGVFNHGKASNRMITEYFEKVFFVELGKTSVIFQDIRNRKGGNTIFLASMRKSVEDWIDRLD